MFYRHDLNVSDVTCLLGNCMTMEAGMKNFCFCRFWPGVRATLTVPESLWVCPRSPSCWFLLTVLLPAPPHHPVLSPLSWASWSLALAPGLVPPLSRLCRCALVPDWLGQCLSWIQTGAGLCQRVTISVTGSINKYRRESADFNYLTFNSFNTERRVEVSTTQNQQNTVIF